MKKTIAEKYEVVLGSTRILVSIASDEIIEHLSHFYELTPTNKHIEGQWEISAYLNSPPVGMHRTQHGVGIMSDPQQKKAELYHPDAFSLGITLRKTIRDAFLEHLEEHHFTMLHASAVFNDEELLVFIGHTNAGKTTLALDCILNNGYKLLSNDHLIIYEQGGDLMGTTFPTVIPVEKDTYAHFSDQLPKEQFHKAEEHIYLTFSEIGQKSPIELPIKDFKTHIFFIGWSQSEAPDVSKKNATIDDFKEHIRSDLFYEQFGHTGFLSRPMCSEDLYLSDSHKLIEKLLKHSTVLDLRHLGELPKEINL